MKKYICTICIFTTLAAFTAEPDFNTLFNEGSTFVQAKDFAAAEKSFESAKTMAKNDNDKFKCVSAQADLKSSQKDFAGMVKILADYAADKSVPADKKKAALLKICSIVHYATADKAIYQQIRDAAEKAVGMSETTVQEKKTALTCLDMTYRKNQDFANSIKVKERILALEGLKDAEKAGIYSEITSIWRHSLRNPEMAKKNGAEAVKYYKADIDASQGPEKARKLSALSNFCRGQMGDNAEADKYGLQAAEAYKAEAEKLSGIDKAEAYSKIAVIYKSMKKKSDTESTGSEAIKITLKVIADSGKLPPKEWLDAVKPAKSVEILKLNKEGCATAATLARKVAAMNEAEDKEKDSVISTAVWICRWGEDSSLLEQQVEFIQMQADRSKTPAAKAEKLLVLGEAYLRNNRDIAKAREIFSSVAANKEFPEKSREDAALWIEMLSDK